MVEYIESLDDFKVILKENKLVVVDFTATWCGPCRMMSPVFEEQSDANKDVKFLKVDVDKAEEVAKAYEISAMPTFIFFKDGEVVERFEGANKDKLVEKIKQLKL